MFGLNNAQLIGRLGADVTVNNLANGGKVANLSIATDESYIDRYAAAPPQLHLAARIEHACGRVGHGPVRALR